MNQKREHDVSTNVPHGLDVEPGGPADIERDINRQTNESFEHGRVVQEDAPETPTTLRTGESKPQSTVDRLNEFLRGELSSVETYDLALQAINDPQLIGSLRQIRESHERRAGLLRERIRTLGGEPAHSSGVWGAFARAVQRGADLLGHRAAIAALEEGEDQGKKRYSRDLDELAKAEQEFVEKDLAPEQIRTHDLARSLQKFAKAA
ncbi:MAG TPA: DUF2383 domain-containing protein [Polyangium sp.]|nr:DUF2383 domain-containing protein [Polyangium sp.]